MKTISKLKLGLAGLVLAGGLTGSTVGCRGTSSQQAGDMLAFMLGAQIGNPNLTQQERVAALAAAQHMREQGRREDADRLLEKIGEQNNTPNYYVPTLRVNEPEVLFFTCNRIDFEEYKKGEMGGPGSKGIYGAKKIFHPGETVCASARFYYRGGNVENYFECLDNGGHNFGLCKKAYLSTENGLDWGEFDADYLIKFGENFRVVWFSNGKKIGEDYFRIEKKKE